MIQTRFGTFETNSSSTHSITICTEEEYDTWRCTDDLLLNEGYHMSGKTFITKQEALNFIRSKNCGPEDYDSEEDCFADWGFYTTSKWDDKTSYFEEEYEEHYTSPSGDKIMAFGYYGHD